MMSEEKKNEYETDGKYRKDRLMQVVRWTEVGTRGDTTPVRMITSTPGHEMYAADTRSDCLARIDEHINPAAPSSLTIIPSCNHHLLYRYYYYYLVLLPLIPLTISH
uniref:Uncharacterized protein n=1 Tax=Syphacia muris TaxID=451379 RepID=A0A0N5ASL9_9BILA